MFYKEKLLVPGIRPNKAHEKLAELESAGKLLAVITQNIDGLHQIAGSQNVIELHGSVHRNRCMRCGKDYASTYVAQSDGVPRCTCGGVVKPDVVLYEEPLDNAVMDAAVSALAGADALDRRRYIAGGLSGGRAAAVFPW